MIVLGVLADTHVPDRRASLDPRVLAVFRSAGVKAILHAGDVSTQLVLDQLAQVAPVYAVRGNRDFARLRHLPVDLLLEFEGVKVGMVHGHGDWQRYFVDKLHWLMEGIQEQRYRRRALAAFTEADVVIFGHLHRPINAWVDGKLLFNPGSSCCPDELYGPASVGLITLSDGKVVKSEIRGLESSPTGL